MTSRVLAAVDIGTNSVHMVVARVDDDGRFEILEREKEMVRLGRSGGDMKRLTDDAIDRGVAALKRCRELADVHDATLAAVATSAVREADNRDEFLRRACDEAGVSVEVISGLEEARLIHLGVLQALPVYDDTLLLCDIGGGSTELLVGRQADVVTSRSFKLGAIRLTERYLSKDVVKPKHIDKARQYVRGHVEGFAKTVRATGFDHFVASSGTAATVFSVALAERGEDVTNTRNAMRITTEELSAAVASILNAPDPESRARIPGVDPKRADIVAAGAIILEEVVGAFGATELIFSDYALREGVLLDHARRLAGATLHHLQDLRRQSVLHLLELTDEDPAHSAQTARLALDLFDGLQPLHDLGPDARELLEAGALLCNVGVSIGHSGHHRHSYYIIRHSEHLSGFTDREIELIAQVARYHRKSAPKKRHPEWAALRESDRAMVTTLAAIVRVAIGLDRGHAARVDSVDATWDDTTITLSMHGRGDEAIDMEWHAAELRSGLLASVFDRRIVLTPA